VILYWRRMSSPKGWQETAYFTVVMLDKMVSTSFGLAVMKDKNLQSCAGKDVGLKSPQSYAFC
jgi:hypothetical protein